jgi:putative phosphoribosyl transferase
MTRITRFRGRTEAGPLLGRKLSKYANRKDVSILALPRGGVPLGFEVAKALNVPRELAMGAIATGGCQSPK